MPILDFDDEALIARAVGTGIADDRAQLAGAANEDSFKRLWPQSPDGSHAGNSLGFLRYLTRDPASALRVESPLGYSLTLDRAVTAPNAVIGVAFKKPAGYRSAWQLMFPGETIFVPGGFNRFWIYCADNLDQITGGLPAAVSRPLGYCSFLVGVKPNAGAPTQRAPHPSARIFYSGDVFDRNYYFGAGAMKRIVVRAVPLDSNGNIAVSTFVTAFRLTSVARSQTTAAAYEDETPDDDLSSLFTHTDRTIHLNNRGSGAAEVSVPLRPAIIHDFFPISTVLRTFTGTTVASVLWQLEGAD